MSIKNIVSYLIYIVVLVSSKISNSFYLHMTQNLILF